MQRGRYSAAAGPAAAAQGIQAMQERKSIGASSRRTCGRDKYPNGPSFTQNARWMLDRYLELNLCFKSTENGLTNAVLFEGCIVLLL